MPPSPVAKVPKANGRAEPSRPGRLPYPDSETVRTPALVGIETVATTGPGPVGAKVICSWVVDPAPRRVPGRG